MPSRPLILLVEDNEDDVALAQLALTKAGHPHRLRVARDGQEAVDFFRGAEVLGDVPAVVLLDLKLPRVNGKEVLRELRGTPATARVPVVILSSSSLEEDVLDGYTLGANSYFQKPVDFGSFVLGASILLTQWLELNVPPRPERKVRETLLCDCPVSRVPPTPAPRRPTSQLLASIQKVSHDVH